MNLGAEATINIVDFLGLRCISKHRLSKKYRVSELDERINKQRLLQEARCLIKCKNHEVHVPNLFLVDSANKSLYLELIEGKTLKVVLNSDISPELKLSSLKDLAQEIAKMHDAEIVHGDLTTSNVIVRDNDNQVFLIDFGLGLLKPTLEDKAVDLYVLARAFTSTHPNSDLMVEDLLSYYFSASRFGEKTKQKYDQVRLRGRKRDMLG
eukprot:gene1155-1226_t